MIENKKCNELLTSHKIIYNLLYCVTKFLNNIFLILISKNLLRIQNFVKHKSKQNSYNCTKMSSAYKLPLNFVKII